MNEDYHHGFLAGHSAAIRHLASALQKAAPEVAAELRLMRGMLVPRSMGVLDAAVMRLFELRLEEEEVTVTSKGEGI